MLIFHIRLELNDCVSHLKISARRGREFFFFFFRAATQFLWVHGPVKRHTNSLEQDPHLSQLLRRLHATHFDRLVRDRIRKNSKVTFR
jgi:hypothetical protein